MDALSVLVSHRPLPRIRHLNRSAIYVRLISVVEEPPAPTSSSPPPPPGSQGPPGGGGDEKKKTGGGKPSKGFLIVVAILAVAAIVVAVVLIVQKDDDDSKEADNEAALVVLQADAQERAQEAQENLELMLEVTDEAERIRIAEQQRKNREKAIKLAEKAQKEADERRRQQQLRDLLALYPALVELDAKHRVLRVQREALKKAKSQAGVDAEALINGEVTAIMNNLRDAEPESKVDGQTVNEFLNELIALLEPEYPDQAARLKELQSNLQSGQADGQTQTEQGTQPNTVEGQ